MTGDEIQRLEDDVHGRTNAAGAWTRRRGYVSGAVPVGCLEVVADVATGGQRQALFGESGAADVADSRHRPFILPIRYLRDLSIM